jgi:hypothetical protein
MYARLDKDAPESQKLKYEPAKNTTLVHPPRDARTKEARKKREQIKAKIKTKTANKEVVTKKPKSQELKEFKENFTKMLQSSQGKRLGRPPLNPTPTATNILWEPQAGFQVNVLASAEFEVLAGGGRASGKSECLLVDPLRFMSNKNFRGLLVRRTMPALREIISRAKLLYPSIFPGTKWKEQEKLFEFPSGAKLEFGYFDHEDDYDRYHGRQFCWLGVDEITQWETQEYYDKLKSTVRRIDNTIPVRVRATCNPSGPGREWVKNYFNIETSVKDKVTKTELRTPEGPIVISRRYILSNVFDNRKLLEANPEYLAYLESLPEIQRRQWLEGDFEANEGMAFEDFARSTHVIKPFNIPNNWVKFRCIDWGYSSRSLAVCLWIAISNNGEAIVYRELAVNKMLASEFARKVLEISSNEYISYSVVDGSVGDKRGSSSPSIDEEFRNEGLICIYADKSPGSRIAGKQLIHKYLRTVDEESKPLLQIFDTCKQIIKELSSLPLDKHNPEDVDTTCEDHAYDALRYGLQSRPNPQLNKSFDQDFFGFGYRNHQRPGLNIVTPPIIDRRFGY